MYSVPPEAVNSIDFPLCIVTESGEMVTFESVDSVSHPIKAKQMRMAEAMGINSIW